MYTNNKITPETIRQSESLIKDKVDRLLIDPSEKSEPIYDGVVDPSLYCSASAKILWILKEPWDESDRSGGGWSIVRDLLKNKTSEMAKGPTFQPIIYVTYGILNRIWSWSDMDYIRDEPTMADILHSIAFINVKKLPGLKKSHDGEILNAYELSRDIILQQIAAYSPDYVIGCRPHMAAIMADHGASSNDIQIHGSAKHFTRDQTKFFDVYHPAQRMVKRDRYINDILSVVQKM